MQEEESKVRRRFQASPGAHRSRNDGGGKKARLTSSNLAKRASVLIVLMFFFTAFGSFAVRRFAHRRASPTGYPWDPAMVEPVRITTGQIPANKSMQLLEYEENYGTIFVLTNPTVVWAKKHQLLCTLAVRRASEADMDTHNVHMRENNDGDGGNYNLGGGFELVVERAVAIQRIHANIQHFLFDDLVAMFADIYITHKGNMGTPDVVLWPIPDEEARSSPKWSFHRNIFDILAPNRHHSLSPTSKVLVKQALYAQRDRGLIWRGFDFEWRKNLKGVPPLPELGHVQVVLDSLRLALPRGGHLETSKTTEAPSCLPKGGDFRSSGKLYLARVGLHGKRVLRNTVEYEQVLESKGYSRWNPMECASLTERWKALEKAQVVVAQFGSDVCNVLWMQRGSTIIDVVHPGASYIDKDLPGDWNYGFFESMAEALGIYHETIFAGERRTGDHDVIAVNEGHSFRLSDGSVVVVDETNPNVHPLPFPPHTLIAQRPAKDITHIDGKPFSRINITRSTTLRETPGAAFFTFSYGMDWVVDPIEVRRQLTKIEAKVARRRAAGAEERERDFHFKNTNWPRGRARHF